jgi:ketol-acid reductoisomerase
MGRPNFTAMRRDEANHPIEVVGKKLREMMPFLTKKPKAAAAAVPEPATSSQSAFEAPVGAGAK